MYIRTYVHECVHGQTNVNVIALSVGEWIFGFWMLLFVWILVSLGRISHWTQTTIWNVLAWWNWFDLIVNYQHIPCMAQCTPHTWLLCQKKVNKIYRTLLCTRHHIHKLRDDCKWRCEKSEFGYIFIYIYPTYPFSQFSQLRENIYKSIYKVMLCESIPIRPRLCI